MLFVKLIGVITLCASASVALDTQDAPILLYECVTSAAPLQAIDPRELAALQNAVIIRCQQAGCQFRRRALPPGTSNGATIAVLCARCPRMPDFTPRCSAWAFEG
ncbi:hypothetical protein TWF694_005985 [Orbilia ellipsospora]|uniref:Secreted protein n=1 Tax=Orbilia ellipsospora TaxID=2528407 RepID=A0AAV9WQV3_9PEZI